MAKFDDPFDTEIPGYESPQQQPAGPDPNDSFAQSVKGFYKSYLARDASDAEINSHRGNPGGINGVEALIRDSEEAVGLRKRLSDEASKQYNTTSPEAPRPYTPSTGGTTQPSPYQAVPLQPQPQGSSSGAIDASYSRLADLLSQMFAQQQSRDAENTAFRNSTRKTLTDRISSLSVDPTMDTPYISSQSKAFRAANERSQRQSREAFAERSHAQGLPSGAFDSLIQSSHTKAGQQQGQFDAQLLGKEVQQQRDSLDKILQMSVGFLSAEDTNALQSHIAQLDAQLRELGAQQTGNLSSQDLDLRRLLGLGSLGIQQQGVTNQNNQFNNRLSLDTGNDDFMHRYLLQQLLAGG